LESKLKAEQALASQERWAENMRRQYVQNSVPTGKAKAGEKAAEGGTGEAKSGGSGSIAFDRLLLLTRLAEAHDKAEQLRTTQAGRGATAEAEAVTPERPPRKSTGSASEPSLASGSASGKRHGRSEKQTPASELQWTPKATPGKRPDKGEAYGEAWSGGWDWYTAAGSSWSSGRAANTKGGDRSGGGWAAKKADWW
jgi:hypothetical protein